MITSSQMCMQNMEQHAIDIFEYDVLLMPFESNVNKSIYAILGAKHIKDFMKN